MICVQMNGHLWVTYLKPPRCHHPRTALTRPSPHLRLCLHLHLRLRLHLHHLPLRQLQFQRLQRLHVK